MSLSSKYDILSGIDVPAHLRDRWRGVLNTLAELLHVRAALVMRVHARQIEVFSRNDGEAVPYHEGETAALDTGLYCEWVMSQRRELAVHDALSEPLWDHNPDLELGMTSYLGLPLEWPTGQIFGTICVLDGRRHRYSSLHRKTLGYFRDLVQDELALVFENHLLREQATEQERIESQLRDAQSHLQALARHLHVGRERERALLARGLHDEIIQNLTAIKMDLDACVRKLPSEFLNDSQAIVSAVDERLMETVHRVREMCENLIPAVLEDLGLAAAIDWCVADFQRRTGVQCEVRATEAPLLISPDVQRLLFRVLEQVLAHVTPGYPTAKLTVELLQRKRAAVLRIAAEGHPPSEPAVYVQERIGLVEMEAQVVSWGGRMRTWRTPDDVAYVEVTMPAPGMKSTR